MSSIETEEVALLEKEETAPGPFAEAFQVASPADRRRLVAGLVAATGRLLLVSRARAISARLKKRNVPFGVLYDFEMMLARRLHPGSKRHRGADYFLDGYYRERVQPYLREVRHLEELGPLQIADVVPVLAEIDREEGAILVRMFLDRELRGRFKDTTDFLHGLEEAVHAARQEENPEEALRETYDDFYEEGGPEAADLLQLRVEHDHVLYDYARSLNPDDERSSGPEPRSQTENERENEAPRPGRPAPPAPPAAAPEAAPVAPEASKKRVDPGALYGWALKHIKQYEEAFDEEEDIPAHANRLLGVFRKLNQERGKEPALAVLEQVIEGAEAANLYPETQAILKKMYANATGVQPPAPASVAEEDEEFASDEVDEGEDEGEDEAGDAAEFEAELDDAHEAPAADETVAPEFESEDETIDAAEVAGATSEVEAASFAEEGADVPVVAPEFEEPAAQAPADVEQAAGFPPEPSEKETFLAEKQAELAELENELRLQLDDIEEQAARISDSEPDEVKAERAIAALGDPQFAPYRERLLRDLEEADDLFRRIMGMLSELSRRLTLQELRTFVDGLIAELKDNAEVNAKHPHLIQRLTNYRNSLRDEPPELLREVHARLDEIRRSRPDYIPEQLAFLKERLADETYRKLWPTIFNIYQNILQQKLDLTLSGIAGRPAPEQLEMFGALQQGFAPGSPVYRELEARRRGAELAGVAGRLERERAGEVPTMASVATVLEESGQGDPVASIKAEIRQHPGTDAGPSVQTPAPATETPAGETSPAPSASSSPSPGTVAGEATERLTASDIEPAEKVRILDDLRASDDPADRDAYVMHQLADHGGPLKARLAALEKLKGRVDPAALEATTAAVRGQAAQAAAPSRIFRMLNEADPEKQAALNKAIAADPNVPEGLRQAITEPGKQDDDAAFDEAFLAITTSSHPPAGKLKFLQALASIAKTRGWLDEDRTHRLQMALEKYKKIAGAHAAVEREHRARHHYYFANAPAIAESVARGQTDQILRNEHEHVHDYNQAQQTIALAASLGHADADGLPPFLKAAIPPGFGEQVDTVLKKKSEYAPGRSTANRPPADDPTEVQFREALATLPFPASRDDLRKLYGRFDDPRRRKILNQMNSMSRDRETRASGSGTEATPAPDTPARATAQQPAIPAPTTATKRPATPAMAAPPAKNDGPSATPVTADALDQMLNSALEDAPTAMDLEIDDLDPAVQVKHSNPGITSASFATPQPDAVEDLTIAPPPVSSPTASAKPVATKATAGSPPTPAPAATPSDLQPEFVTVAPEFEAQPGKKKKRKPNPNHETRAPSWDERIAGGLSKLGGTLSGAFSGVGGSAKKEPRPDKSDDWKKFSVSKLGAKATKDFFDFSRKKKAEDIYASLVTQEELIGRIKDMPEFKKAQQDPKKVDQIAESVKNSIAVTVMVPKDVKPIGFPDTLCFPRKDWFDDIKRKKLIKATKEMAKKNNPGSERHNYYMWLVEEIEMRYYQSKYKRGKLD